MVKSLRLDRAVLFLLAVPLLLANYLCAITSTFATATVTATATATAAATGRGIGGANSFHDAVDISVSRTGGNWCYFCDCSAVHSAVATNIAVTSAIDTLVTSS
jgi:hypothetical protein